MYVHVSAFACMYVVESARMYGVVETCTAHMYESTRPQSPIHFLLSFVARMQEPFSRCLEVLGVRVSRVLASFLSLSLSLFRSFHAHPPPTFGDEEDAHHTTPTITRSDLRTT